MKQEMGLVAIYLNKPIGRLEIERRLGVSLQKGIEAMYYAAVDNTLLTYMQFNVLCLVNYSHEQVIDVLDALEYEKAEVFEKKGTYQDYPLVIDDTILSPFLIDNDKITLQAFSLTHFLIITHVISQSVALDVYEQKLSDYYERSRDLIDSADTFSMFKRNRLARFAKQLVLIRHDMIIDLHLLDKPDIVWENEDVEALYNALAAMLELKDRFEVVEYKLTNIKDDIVMVMDLTNHNHSSFLEWIIIVLIGVEIVMGLYEFLR